MDARFDLAAALSDSTVARLQPRDDIAEPGWRFWEKRNLNIHRVVALGSLGAPSAMEIEIQARAALSRNFRRAWWRGLGFGVVVEVPDVEGLPETFLELVDGRENPKGTWQWIIAVARERKKAAGVHTWIEGYLSPVYRDFLAYLEARGFEVESVRKEKDGLLKLLTAAKPRLFPEFRNETGNRSRSA